MKDQFSISDLLRIYAHRHVASYFGRMDGELEYRERKGRMIVADLKFEKEHRYDEKGGEEGWANEPHQEEA